MAAVETATASATAAQDTRPQPPLLQAHWAPARGREVLDGKADWQDVPLPGSMRGRVMALRLGFRGLP